MQQHSRGGIIMYRLLIILMPFVIGCGSMVHGRFQDVPISSTPEGATVTINNELKGETPVTLKLKRKTNEYVVVIDKEGYVPFNTILTRKTHAGTTAGNVLIDFGLISHFIIDRNIGGAYCLIPSEIDVELKEE